MRLKSKPLQYLVFDNLIFDGSNYTDTAGGSLIYAAVNASNITWRNCEIRNSPKDGFQFTGNGPLLLQSCWAHHNGRGAQPGNGVYGAASNISVIGGKYERNPGFGIRFFSSEASITTSGCVADGVESSNNGQGGVVIGDSGNKVQNSNLHHNGDGVSVTTKANGCVVKSCQITSNNRYGVEVGNSWSNPVGTRIEFNNFSGNASDPIKISSGTGTVQVGNTFGGTAPPPPPTNVDVTQTQPPVSQPLPATSQPSGPSTSAVAVPFLIAGVIGAALLLGSD
jgi:hypothetical protein